MQNFRSLVARANDLAAGKADTMYSVKEICGLVASSTVGALQRIKHLGRYLLCIARLTTRYDWQGEETETTGYSDSALALCRVRANPRVARPF